MSWFSRKKVEENKEEANSYIETRKELLIILTFAFGTHHNYTMTCKADTSIDGGFEQIKKDIIDHLGENYILETSNGAHNLKYFCSVTFEEKEVAEVVVDE